MIYAIISGSTIIATGSAQQLWPNVSFGPGGPDAAWLAANNAVLITQPPFDQNSQVLSPCSPYISGSAVYNATVSPMSPAQMAPIQYNAAIAAGLSITSTGTPAMPPGPYACDAVTCVNLAQVNSYITVNHKFPAGQAQFPMKSPAVAVVYEFASTALYQAAASAIADYVAGCDLARDAQLATNTAQSWPMPTVAIP